MAPRKTEVTQALVDALRETPTQPQDGAAIALAMTYARKLDAGSDELAKLGRDFLAVLVQLGMTPAARAAVTKGGAPDVGGARQSDLDKLRQRRRARLDGASVVDSPAS